MEFLILQVKFFKTIKYALAFAICLSSLAAFSQDTIEAVELSAKKPFETNFFRLGVDYLTKGEYEKADSLFTLSFEAGDRTIDTYFDRALARKKLGNLCGSCVDMLCAAELGDAEANSFFWQRCTGMDSVLACVKNMRVVIRDTVATMTNFDSASNTKRISIVQQIKGLSNRYFINSNGEKKTVELNDPFYNLMPDGPIYDLPEVQELPEFPGGDLELMKFLNKNIQYPSRERDRGIQGKVFVTFIIDKTGSVMNVSIYKGIYGGEAFNQEALRVIRLMPKWKPGRKYGEVVSVRYILPIYFKLG